MAKVKKGRRTGRVEAAQRAIIARDDVVFTNARHLT
jgi:hypothetical protein